MRGVEDPTDEIKLLELAIKLQIADLYEMQNALWFAKFAEYHQYKIYEETN